jgi:hypothetical protein
MDRSPVSFAPVSERPTLGNYLHATRYDRGGDRRGSSLKTEAYFSILVEAD